MARLDFQSPKMYVERCASEGKIPQELASILLGMLDQIEVLDTDFEERVRTTLARPNIMRRPLTSEERNTRGE